MIALTPHETLMGGLLLHVLLVAMPAVAGFLVGRRGQLPLWQVAALVLLTALLLLPAVSCRRLLGRPDSWPSVLRMDARGWPTMLVAFSLGCGLGVLLLRSGRRGRLPREVEAR